MTAVENEAAVVPSALEAGMAALRRFWRPFFLIQGTAALVFTCGISRRTQVTKGSMRSARMS